jgi:hypothetical protein
MQARRQGENLVSALSRVNALILVMVESYILILRIILDYLLLHQESLNYEAISIVSIALQLKGL